MRRSWAQTPLQVVSGINYDIITPACMEDFRHETWFEVMPGESMSKAFKLLPHGLGVAIPAEDDVFYGWQAKCMCGPNIGRSVQLLPAVCLLLAAIHAMQKPHN